MALVWWRDGMRAQKNARIFKPLLGTNEAGKSWRDTMKKFLLGTVGLVALGMAAPASAADLRARPAPPPPMVAAIYDWSGFYIGGNGGWGQSRNCVDFVTFADACSERSGGLAGGQLGYRWQAGTWVFGLEGQGDWADLSNTRVSVFRPEFSTRTKTDGIGLFTGQIGWAWNTALFYVKGGAAVTGNRFSILDTLTGIEYDHLFMGDANNSFSVANPALAAVLNSRITQDVDMVTVRVNYRFGGYGGG